MQEPCQWDLDFSDGVCSALEGLPTARQTLVKQMAIDFLWRWTERRFGVCHVVYRPPNRNCQRRDTFTGRGPYTRYGLDEECCCPSKTTSVYLPGPVVNVTEVKIEGVVFTDWAFVPTSNALYRTDGQNWPGCQAPYGTENSWEVSYDRGRLVPAGGQLAAAQFACELAKALVNDKSCALPQRLQSVTRQGVTIAVLDGFDDIDEGHTGIWAIDSWIASITKSAQSSTVLSPDFR